MQHSFFVFFFLLPSLEFSLDVWETHCTFICFLYSADKFKADDHSFLFTLISPSGTQPIRLSAEPSADRNNGGILCRTRLGPCFGSESYFKLRVPNAVEGYNYLPATNTGFICPPNVTRAFTPEEDFNIRELEIFKVNFES